VLAGLADKARDGKLAANWVINELFGRLNKEGRDITGSPVSSEQLGAIVDLIGEGTISGKMQKTCSRSSGPRAATPARWSTRAA
jgi:aspartyl-tRNA(Asn)/glutamyl-tRNA(Gln) amidotransferase subunit B